MDLFSIFSLRNHYGNPTVICDLRWRTSDQLIPVFLSLLTNPHTIRYFPSLLQFQNRPYPHQRQRQRKTKNAPKRSSLHLTNTS
jgi:hypothetical protein